MRWILGTANFGNMYKDLMVGQQLAISILDKAWDLGIRDLDTARSYGLSENMIGEYIQKTGHKFRVWTKGRSAEDYEESKKILGFIPYNFLWHNWEELDEVKIQIDGISIYHGVDWIDAFHKNGISSIQFPWNIIDRDSEWQAERAHQYGLATVARSIFIKGEAFKMPDIAGAPFWQWCLDVPDCFDYVVIGADTPEQLEQVITAPRLNLVYTEEGVKCQRQ